MKLCPYKKSCPEYERDSLNCCFLYNFCKTKRHYERTEEQERVRFEQSRLIKLSGQME